MSADSHGHCRKNPKFFAWIYFSLQKCHLIFLAISANTKSIVLVVYSSSSEKMGPFNIIVKKYCSTCSSPISGLSRAALAPEMQAVTVTTNTRIPNQTSLLHTVLFFKGTVQRDGSGRK